MPAAKTSKTSRASRADIKILEQINTSMLGSNGGIVAPPYANKHQMYAQDGHSKVIARTTLESLTNRGYLKYSALTDNGNYWPHTWRITSAGLQAINDAKAGKGTKTASSARKSPAQLDKEIAAFLDWKAQVRAIMKSSGFDEDMPYGGSEDALYYSTRDDGDVGEEQPGPADIRGAKELRARVQSAVPGVKGAIDTVDEWTNLKFTKH